MTKIYYDDRGVQLYTREVAWVREVPPTQHRKMTRYEVIQGGKLCAIKYTRTGAQLLADGFNKLLK